ncbi:MAG: BMP family ABC transporter substrate-binding protein [Oscillospiraceae bacterium]
MKKALALLLALVLALSLVACGSKPEAPAEPEAPATDGKKVYSVCNLVNGNLGDKSFFDSCEEGLKKLAADGVITYETLQMGGTDADRPKWETTLNDVSASGEYDYIIVATWQMTDLLKVAAEKYPDQKYIYYDNEVPGAPNICNINYAQNQMGYLIGVYAAMVTSQTDIDGINPEKVVGFIGGGDQPVINDFLYGFLEGVKATDPEVKVDTRYTESFVDAALGKELALSMVTDNKADVIWGVAGGAGYSAAEVAVEKGTWFIGVDSDQEKTLPADQAARTLTSGLKNIGDSMIWFFTELNAGKDHVGETVSLDLSNNGVGVAMFGNFSTIASQDTQDAVVKAMEDIQKGTIKVSSAIGDESNGVATLRDSMKP